MTQVTAQGAPQPTGAGIAPASVQRPPQVAAVQAAASAALPRGAEPQPMSRFEVTVWGGVMNGMLGAIAGGAAGILTMIVATSLVAAGILSGPIGWLGLLTFALMGLGLLIGATIGALHAYRTYKPEAKAPEAPPEPPHDQGAGTGSPHPAEGAAGDDRDPIGATASPTPNPEAKTPEAPSEPPHDQGAGTGSPHPAEGAAGDDRGPIGAAASPTPNSEAQPEASPAERAGNAAPPPEGAAPSDEGDQTNNDPVSDIHSLFTEKELAVLIPFRGSYWNFDSEPEQPSGKIHPYLDINHSEPKVYDAPSKEQRVTIEALLDAPAAKNAQPNYPFPGAKALILGELKDDEEQLKIDLTRQSVVIINNEVFDFTRKDLSDEDKTRLIDELFATLKKELGLNNVNEERTPEAQKALEKAYQNLIVHLSQTVWNNLVESALLEQGETPSWGLSTGKLLKNIYKVKIDSKGERCSMIGITSLNHYPTQFDILPTYTPHLAKASMSHIEGKTTLSYQLFKI